MAKSVLIVTPQTVFGGMLRSSLEETGQFRVFMAGDEPTALVQLKSESCDAAFLDVDLGMEAVLEIGRALRTVRANLELVIVSDEALPPELDALRPWTVLRKPFYLPEVMEMLNTLLSPDSKAGSSPAPGSAASPAPESTDLLWLQDVNKAAQRLTRLTLESSAQAALITRGKLLWAYAGGLSQEAANELVRIISRTWDEQKGGDLLRFARLETTHAEHMLYATTLAEGVVLALAFDAETPFSIIRSQANALARSLALGKTGPMPSVSSSDPYSVLHMDAASSQTEEEDAQGALSIADIINDIPAPIPPAFLGLQPDVSVASLPETRHAPAETPEVVTGPSVLAEKTPHSVSRESSPPVRLDDLVMNETIRHEPESLDTTLPSKQARPLTPVRPPQSGELDETRPHSVTEVAGRAILESTSPGMYQLNYACLLVPRFSSHYLTGDLAARLNEWLPNICVAFGWRLEFLSVRPEYLQWVVSVPPNTSPGYLMRIMRQQTSEKIFAEFPRMKKENPSGDFWAPGYLIMGGAQPHPQQLVKDYIKQTRQRQGMTAPRQ